jgi:hypothetical protein
MLPWINNIEKYKYYLGIIYSRAYSITLDRYEILKGYKITSEPIGHLHKELIKTLTIKQNAIILYPFIDNCNHKITSPLSGRESFNFNTLQKKGELEISIHNKIKQGEEYAYTYSPNMPNEKFVFRYGFFLKNNPNAITFITVNLKKADFSRRKNEICKIIRCFDQPFDELYSQNEIEKFSLLINIGKFDISKRILDALRLYAFPENKLDNFEDVIKRLTYDQWLDYYTEMKALSYYRDSIVDTTHKKKASYVIKNSNFRDKIFFKILILKKKIILGTTYLFFS